MDPKDYEKLLEKVERTMELLADIDLFGYGNAITRKNNQKKLNKAYDILFKTKNYIKNKIKKGEEECSKQ